MYFVYILLNIQKTKTHVGITDDIQRRLSQHSAGYNTYTSRHRPWIVIYKEDCADRVQARVREKYLKSASGRRWMQKKFFINK